MPCELTYIPDHLHRNGRELLPDFMDGEYFYQRVSPKIAGNPFEQITLAELSVNRSGINNELSNKDDVLFNIDPADPKEIYDTHSVRSYELRLVDSPTCNDLSFEVNHGNDNCRICFEHDPLDCNYAHCNLELYLNQDRVLKRTYTTTLGHSDFKKLRNKIRAYLASFIINGCIVH